MTDIVSQLFAAMASASGEMEGASRDALNPHLKNKYANLSSVVAAIKPALVKNGLWFRQVMHEREKGVCIETLVCHKAGHEISFGSLFVPASKQDAQGFGSALTYARRYSLMTAFGICPEDDDGNAAAASPPQVEPAPELPTGPINDATRDWISGKIDGRQIPVGELCKAFSVTSLKGLNYDQIDAVKAWIRDYKKEAA